MGYADLESALTYGWEVERSFRCINPEHNDNSASASINAVSGLFVCYACGYAGKVDMDKVEVHVSGLKKYTAKVFARLEEGNRYSEGWLNAFDSAGPGSYWLGRFDAATCRTFRLGQAPGVATYPMRDNGGEVMGVVTRDLTGQRRQKYLYPPGVKNSQYLLDYHAVESENVVLVEGMADVAAVAQTGQRMALGCYRAWLSAAQAKLLRKYEPRKVFVAFDQDRAGDLGAARVEELLASYTKVVRLTWDQYKDLAEMPLDQRVRMLDLVR